MQGDLKYETKVSIGPHDLTDWLCENGRFGQKAGRGFYTYNKDRTKTIDPEVHTAIQSIRVRKGLKEREIPSDEIRERILFGLINEGFKILEENMAQRPSDIDIVYIYGYGFPPVMGGPMHYADRYVTLPVLLDRLRGYDKQQIERSQSNPNYPYKGYFKPSQLLIDCVNAKMTLSDFWMKKSQTSKM